MEFPQTQAKYVRVQYTARQTWLNRASAPYRDLLLPPAVIARVHLHADVVDGPLGAVNDGILRLPILLEHLRDEVQLVLVEIVLVVRLDDVLYGARALAKCTCSKCENK